MFFSNERQEGSGLDGRGGVEELRVGEETVFQLYCMRTEFIFIKGGSWVVVACVLSLIPALGRQRQVDLCEFEASLVYRVSLKTTRAVTQKNPISKTNKQSVPHYHPPQTHS